MSEYVSSDNEDDCSSECSEADITDEVEDEDEYRDCRATDGRTASQEYKYQVQEESKTLTEELGNFMASDNTVTDEKLLRRIHSDDTPFTLEKLEYAAYAAFQRVLERSACTLDILVLCWWPEYLRPFFTFPILPKLRSFAMCKNSAYGHNGEFIWTSSDLLVKHTPALQLFSIFMHRDGSSEEKGKKSFKFVSWRPTDRTRHKPVSELNPDIWHPSKHYLFRHFPDTDAMDLATWYDQDTLLK